LQRPVLTKENVLLNAVATGWEEAVRIAGELLYNNGYVEKRFSQAMINAVREMGPYIVLAPGIALPHARPEDGALKTGIALVTLNKPVNFGSVVNDPVDIIIGLASVDHVSHIQLLQRMCNFLADNDKLDCLRQMRDSAQVADFINSSGKEEV
jgi:mannitol operon transcriptional antiterminator